MDPGAGETDRGARTPTSYPALRFLTFLCVLCLTGVCAYAQAVPPDLPRSILTQLSQHAAVRANFIQQRQSPALTQIQTSSGRFLIVTGHGMLWQVQQPYTETLSLNGTRIRQIDADGSIQPMRGASGVGHIAQMLQGMLTGQLDEIRRQFNVQASGTKEQWHLHFTPKQSRMAQVLRSIQLDGGAFLKHIRIDMKDGTQTDIQMFDIHDAGPLNAWEKHVLGLP